jgi:hypothetical protein
MARARRTPLALLAVAALAGCGNADQHRRPPPAGSASLPRVALGLTEGDAQLLWRPVSEAASSDPLLSARRALDALHPRYVRLLVDWAAVQPDPREAPQLDARVAGCARTTPPCASFAGIRGQLEAIASQQRASDGFQVLVDVLGAPAWAVAPPHGCESPSPSTGAMALRASALGAYRALIADLLALAGRVGARLDYWSPWNEPNDPRFLTPQRAACSASAAPLAPAAYAQLAEAMDAELAGRAGLHQLVLGELGGYLDGSAHRTGIAEFVSALPARVLCASDLWSVHAYSRWGERGPASDPVPALERTLAADRASCHARSARSWVTEAGTGAEDPGRPREGSAGEQRQACRALAASVAGWAADRAVAAVFQYTFRDDPAFPVGLASADLSRLYPTYRLWRRFTERASPDALAAACQ